ncbi:B3 domain-containing protein Os11g0197600-like [Phalaenopsis equestris]|uniref:B3 domain-containing protein Os11g0197600-like n=1 Tax=Phalaenopsis equestris TaxID=78828 RepID=UPI0009E4AA50|nr:B3 domain-containing protein Os11g0197600-like [Phalaenopsis equestris]
MEKPLWERDSFFKVMIGDFQTSLRIPPCFYKHLSGDILVKSVLRSRGGRRWAVMLRREGNSLFFGEGWDCFVADLSVQLGEFLLFVYDGDLGFDVKVYGTTGCEKEDPIAAVKVEHEVEEREIRGELRAETSTTLIRAPIRRREVLNGRVILGGLKVFGNERALKTARSFKSSRPFFIATYRSSRQEYMTIPVSFIRECNIGKMETIILKDQKGRSWPVRIAHWIGRVAMAKGWPKFSEVNHLKEGDVCVFEFLEADRAICVHIFRDKKNIATGLRRADNKKREAEVLKAERSFRTDARFASTFLKSRKYTLNIPTHVLKEIDVTKASKTTLRDPSGRSWLVDIKHRVDGRVHLGQGWFLFCKENHIKEKDICIFELTGGIQEMDVQICRRGLHDIATG